MSKSDTRIYVGNLPPDIRSKDIEDLFYKYGKIRFVDLKNRKGPPFAFIEYDDPRDAEDAVKGRDRYNFDGYRLRVEFQKGNRLNSDRGGSSRGGGGGGANNGPPRRSDNRVIVSGLPPTGSWQDLKDHMRDAGQVCYADVFKDGTGVVEFTHYDDMKYALKNLDDTKFRSHEGETGYIRLKADVGGRRSSNRSVSRSRSRSRGRQSPTYSRSRSRSYDSLDYDRKRVSKNSRKHSRSRSPRSRSRSASPPPKKHAASSSRSRSPRSRSVSPRKTSEELPRSVDGKDSAVKAENGHNGEQEESRNQDDE